MSFSSQLAGSATIDKYSFNATQVPSAGGIGQQSCYSTIEKISALTNPVSLQHDVMYANAFAAVIERNELSENEAPLALGCVGHQPDREFPLESKTTVPLPLIMYPTETCGNTLDTVDMCALPVLNWEKYIQTIKVHSKKGVISMEKRNTNQRGQDEDEVTEHIPEEQETLQQSADLDSSIAIEGGFDILSEPSTNSYQTHNQSNVKRMKIVPEQDNSNQSSNTVNLKEKNTRHVEGIQKTQRTITHTYPLRKILNVPLVEIKDEIENMLSEKCLNDKIVARKQRCRELKTEDKLTLSSLIKLKCQPSLRVEGTWNHLYGGYNGACCFMQDKTSKKLCLFLGKGSLLRAVELKKASPSSIFSYTVESVWDEDPTVSSSDSNSDPFDELIFQLVPNEANDLLGLRRGRTIQIYNTDGDIPDLLEVVPNTSYGASKYYHNTSIHGQNKTFSQNPLLRGFDFNPTFGPEIISIDENQVVRVCDIYKRTISEQFLLPSSSEHVPTSKNYPDFKLNDAVGVTFANNNHLFYAWGNSVVFMGDRRSKKYSRSHIFPLFDVRNHVHSLALSSQNYFHEATSRLNEYMSCVRRSKRDPYYYVGTTMKIYLMDLRVPSHPVIAVNHGLQSPLAYMDTYLDKEENFETIVAGSQRSSETVCMISDFAHLECIQRPGCKNRNPLLYCYPRHLLNPKSYFDSAVNEGYDFPYPVDSELVKNHLHAWSTGLAVFPMHCDNKMRPGPMIVTSCNNFGDVFWQEWGQKPMPSHRKLNLTDLKLQSFLAEWHREMKGPECDMRPRPSKNPMKPTNCTILLEPLAKEIEKLTKVRDSPFDCFKPDQVRNYVNRKSMLPMNQLCNKLRKYKNPHVKGIVDVWCTSQSEIPETIGLEAEQVEIKIEPHDYLESHSPANTIDIDMESGEEEQVLTENLAQIEFAIQNLLNVEESGENLDNFISNEHIPGGWSGGYPDIAENSFPFDPIYGTQDLYDNDIPHSSSQQFVKRTQKKSKKSGF